MIRAKPPKFDKATPHRVCAVCGQRHGPTYGFKNTLRYHGITVGDKATVECIRKLALRKKEGAI